MYLCNWPRVPSRGSCGEKRQTEREREEKAGSLSKVTRLCGWVGELPASIKASRDQCLL